MNQKKIDFMERMLMMKYKHGIDQNKISFGWSHGLNLVEDIDRTDDLLNAIQTLSQLS